MAQPVAITAADVTERRRFRTCPVCGGKNILRGQMVPHLQVTVGRHSDDPREAPVFSNVCRNCGSVTFFVRRLACDS